MVETPRFHFRGTVLIPGWRTRILTSCEVLPFPPKKPMAPLLRVLPGLPPSTRSAYSWHSGKACSFSVVEGSSIAHCGTSGPCVSCRLLPPPAPTCQRVALGGWGPEGGPPRLRQNLSWGAGARGAVPLAGAAGAWRWIGVSSETAHHPGGP